MKEREEAFPESNGSGAFCGGRPLHLHEGGFTYGQETLVSAPQERTAALAGAQLASGTQLVVKTCFPPLAPPVARHLDIAPEGKKLSLGAGSFSQDGLDAERPANDCGQNDRQEGGVIDGKHAGLPRVGPLVTALANGGMLEDDPRQDKSLACSDGILVQRACLFCAFSLEWRGRSSTRWAGDSAWLMNNLQPSAPTRSTRTRVSLLQRLRNTEDQASWNEFYDLYAPLIRRVAARARLSEAEIEDVLQEVMRAMAQELPRFVYDASKGRFKSWLCQQARWKVIDQIRERSPFGQLKHHGGSDPGCAGSVDNVADPQSLITDEVVEQEWRENQFAIAWARVKAQLDPLKAQLFDFYAIKGWRAEKVAEHFLVTVGVVRTNKSRVKQMIQDQLEAMEQDLD